MLLLMFWGRGTAVIMEENDVDFILLMLLSFQQKSTEMIFGRKTAAPLLFPYTPDILLFFLLIEQNSLVPITNPLQW